MKQKTTNWKKSRNQLILLAISIGLILLLLFDGVPKEKDLFSIKGTLSETPKFLKHGADVPHKMIEIELVGVKRKFHISGCGYKVVDKNTLNQYKKGDLVEIWTKDEISSFGRYPVYYLKIGDKDLLNLTMYADCKSKSNTILLPILLIMVIVNLKLIYNKFHNTR